MGAVFELEISASEKLVLLAMADHARDDGTGCYPSIETLARKTSQSRRGVQKIMRKLEEIRGLIEPSKVSQGRRTTEYRITLGNREQGSLLVAGVNREPGSLLVTGANREPGSSQPRTRKQPTANQETRNREPGSPEPLRTVIEPSKEPRPHTARPAPPHSASFPANSEPGSRLFPPADEQKERRSFLAELRRIAEAKTL
jgi:helix-turn-helix protein